MRSLLLMVAMFLIAAALACADAPPASRVDIEKTGGAVTKAALTAHERSMLLGLSARAELVRIQAQRQLEELDAEQREVLVGLAKRLDLTLEALRDGYTIRLDTSMVERKPTPPPASGAHAK